MPQTGFRDFALAGPFASVRWCLDQSASQPCGPARVNRTEFNTDMCSLRARVDSGDLYLLDALRGTSLDVLLIPEEDEVIWNDPYNGEGSAPADFGGLVGDFLKDVALRGGFQWNVIVTRPPARGDIYGGNWDAWALDWVNRVDLIGGWFFDRPERRAAGLSYPFNFYALDPVVIAVDRGLGRKLSFFEYNPWAFLDPFTFRLWICIAVMIVLTGILERYVEGHMSNSFDRVIETLSKGRFDNPGATPPLEQHGTVSLRLDWVEHDASLEDLNSSQLPRRARVGTVVVKLIRATDLMGVDKRGKILLSDPYAVLVGGNETFRSEVRMRTLNPSWNEEYIFAGTLQYLIDLGITLTMYDYDPLFNNKKLGECHLPLAELLEVDSKFVDLPLTLAPTVDCERKEVYLKVARKYRLRLQLGDLLFGVYMTAVSFLDGAGYYCLVESKTPSGRLIVLAWELGCCLFIASYTANLAQIMVYSNQPEEDMSTISFESLRARSSPVCLRDGTAIASMMQAMLPPGQLRIQPGNMPTAHKSAADALRSGGCDGFVQPLWVAQDMLVGTSNRACDLRIVYPTISTVTGGYIGAAQWLRQQVPNLSPEYSCPDVITNALGGLFQQTCNEMLGTLREQQVGRLRNNTCLADGSPAGSEVQGRSSQLDVPHFFGLLMIMSGMLLLALLMSDPVRRFIAGLSEGSYRLVTYARSEVETSLQENEAVGGIAKTFGEASNGLHAASLASVNTVRQVTSKNLALKMSKRNRAEEADAKRRRKMVTSQVISELVGATPRTSEWRETVDQRLEKLEATMVAVDTKMSSVLDAILAVHAHSAQPGRELAPAIAPSSISGRRPSSDGESAVLLDVQVTTEQTDAPSHADHQSSHFERRGQQGRRKTQLWM